MPESSSVPSGLHADLLTPFDSGNTTRACDGRERVDRMQLHIAVFDGSTPSDLYRHLSTLGSTTTIAAYNEYTIGLARRTFKDRRGVRSSRVSTLFGPPIARDGCTTTIKLNFDDFVEVHTTEEPATDSAAILTESSSLLVRTLVGGLKQDEADSQPLTPFPGSHPASARSRGQLGATLCYQEETRCQGGSLSFLSKPFRIARRCRR